MATNDFLVFGGGAGANVIPQVTYSGLTARTAGFSAGVAQSAQLNKVWRQSSIMAAVLGQFISDITGQDVLDDGSTATILANLKASVAAQTSAIVGWARNLTMNVTSAAATATVTADEVIVKSSLGGKTYLLSTFSQSINLGTTGAGGMDTGTAPVNGWVAVYAIHNPATAARALLGVNATSVVAPEIYGGANLPAGYSASALVSVRRTNGSGLFAVGSQLDRTVETSVVSVLAGGAATTYTTVSLASAVPPNARYANFTYGMTTNSASNGAYLIATDTTNEVGLRRAISQVVTQILGGAWADVRLFTPQSVIYKNDAVGGTLGLNVVGYKF